MPCFSRISLVIAVSLAAGCAAPGSPARHFLAKFGAPKPEIDRVAVCWGYGCRQQPEVDMTVAWAAIASAFAEPPATAKDERARVAEAVAAWERAAAEDTPIGLDVGGTFEGIGEAGQLDCVDEAVNTTRLLVLLQESRLMRFHVALAPASRGAFLLGWPHISAVLMEKQTGIRFAIDSWFHDNGVTAEVVPLDTWLVGWAPAESATP